MTDVTISTPTSRILSGSVGSIIYVLAFNPLEVVKIREQAMTTSTSTASSISSSSGIDRFMLPQQQMRRGVFSTIASIYRNEGRAALFTGVRPTLLAAIPNVSSCFRRIVSCGSHALGMHHLMLIQSLPIAKKYLYTDCNLFHSLR